MNITVKLPFDRRNFIDADGLMPDSSTSDTELLLALAESDYKQFSFDVADAVIETLKNKQQELPN